MKPRKWWRLVPVSVVLLGALLWQVQAQPPRAQVRVRRLASPPSGQAAAKLPELDAKESYRLARERNLFRPLVVAQSAPAVAAPVAAAAAELMEPEALPPVSPWRAGGRNRTTEQATPLSDDWVYAGYAAVDGVPLAILERPATKQALFLRVGDSSEAGKVTGITPQQVALALSDGGELRLACATTFVATPLNPTEQQRQAARGQGGQGRQGGLLADPRARDFMRRLGERLGLLGPQQPQPEGSQR